MAGFDDPDEDPMAALDMDLDMSLPFDEQDLMEALGKDSQPATPVVSMPAATVPVLEEIGAQVVLHEGGQKGTAAFAHESNVPSGSLV